MKNRNHKIPIIMYHRILAQKNIFKYRSYQETGSVLSVSDFVTQINLLKKHYSIISLDQLIDHLNEQTLLPPNPCVLSFDDGYIDHYRNVFPVLNKMGLPGVFFIVGDCIAGTKKVRWLDKYYYILDNTLVRNDKTEFKKRLSHFYQTLTDKKQPFSMSGLKKMIRISSKKEKIINTLANILGVNLNLDTLNKSLYISQKHIKEMLNNKMDFGAHTMSHPDLKQMTFYKVKKEILDSGNIIRNITNREKIPFAYPFGSGSTYSAKMIKVLESNNFSCACTSVPGLNDKNTSLFKLKRIDAINLPKSLF